jgi:hypothetical protein
LESGASKIAIHFDGGAQIIIRPNRIVRGKKKKKKTKKVAYNVFIQHLVGNVVLKNTRPIQASQIRVKVTNKAA